ncbi:unnamed protein product [Lymnaea stagnalis]|uniref:Uncharacterized protein n=1 Tax=Lymnaea stagnalis TaxID=6523 RepID=A0AAV2IMG5_LYMST
MFSCCMQMPVMEEEKPLVVDLKKILCDKAWSSFRSTFGTCQRRFLKRDKFLFEVPENYFLFETVEQTLKPRRHLGIIPPDDRDRADGGASDAVNKQLNQGMLKGKVSHIRDLTNPEVLSLDTVFKNDTAERQLYKFRFEKSRRTEINVSFQKGFTFGGKANFSIGIPKIFGEGELGIETEMQYQVSRSEGQTFEETIVMEATSDIAVGPNSCYTANVQLEEKNLFADFKIISRLSMPQGRAPVYIKRKSDGEQVFVYNAKNLPDIFDQQMVPCAQQVKESPDDKHPSPTKIDFVIEGVVKGNLACNHRIELKSDEAPELKSEAQSRLYREGKNDDDRRF